MTMSRISIVFCGAALLFSSGALGGETYKGTLRLGNKVSVDGKPLDPGKYKVEWGGTGPKIQVTLLQGKRTMATFPAHVTEQAAPNPDDAYGTTAEPDGSRLLTAIYPGGKRFVLHVDQKEAGPQSSAHTSN